MDLQSVYGDARVAGLSTLVVSKWVTAACCGNTPHACCYCAAVRGGLGVEVPALVGIV